MIKKFLLVDRRVSLVSVVPEAEDGPEFKSIELLIPIDIYWGLQELLRHSSVMLSDMEPFGEVQQIYRDVFRKALPYAVFEVDRAWLYDKLRNNNPSTGASTNTSGSSAGGGGSSS